MSVHRALCLCVDFVSGRSVHRALCLCVDFVSRGVFTGLCVCVLTLSQEECSQGSVSVC